MNTEVDEEAETLAKETVLLSLYKLYRYLDGKTEKALRELTREYLPPLDRFTSKATRQAYEAIRDGDVPEAVEWLPSVPRWVGLVKTFDRAQRGPLVLLHNGLIDMDFGHGRIDMRGLTEKEQDRVIALGGVISGRNMALLSLDEKRASLNGLPAPDSPRIEAPSPRLRKM